MIESVVLFAMLCSGALFIVGGIIIGLALAKEEIANLREELGFYNRLQRMNVLDSLERDSQLAEAQLEVDVKAIMNGDMVFVEACPECGACDCDEDEIDFTTSDNPTMETDNGNQ